MSLRSTMPRGSWWIGTLLALPILGASVLTAIAFQFLSGVENDTHPWVNHRLVRGACSLLLLGFAAWLSSQLSQLQSWVDLDGISLVMKGFCSGRIRRESLCDLRAINSDGRVEFEDGRTVHLGDHPLILNEVRWWQAHGFRHPRRSPS